jgi:uncharacterized protein (TIGR02217 family)
MSAAVFPTMPGLKIDVSRTPQHKTKIKESVSGTEYRARLMSAPRYAYKLSFEFLRDGAGFNEFRPLLGFFNARGGSFESWLFRDPDDRTVTGQAFGIGDGTATQFQLVRTLGGNVEPVYALDGAPSIYVSGVLKSASTDYTINATGGVTFVAPLAAGAVAAWSGAYYWRCRFMRDQVEFGRFSTQLWELKTCDFITVKAPYF